MTKPTATFLLRIRSSRRQASNAPDQMTLPVVAQTATGGRTQPGPIEANYALGRASRARPSCAREGSAGARPRFALAELSNMAVGLAMFLLGCQLSVKA